VTYKHANVERPMFRILIAGLGSIGRRHLNNLRQLGVNDVLLYRTHPGSLEEAPELPVFTELTDALAANPNAVVICNPTAYHLKVAIPAAEAGCHLFIEKPLSHSWGGVERLLSVVQAKHLTGIVGFDLRFDPGLCKVKSLVDEGRIGRLVAIQAQVGQYLPDWRPWEDYRMGMSARVETGGGVIFDLIHELDYVSWLMGPVSHVACFADKVSNLEIETEDTAAILLRFENGAIGTVHLDYIQRIPNRTCRFIGEKGTVLWDYFAKKVCWFETGKDTWQAFEYPEYERNDRFLAEMRHFLACLRGEEQPKVDLLTGSRVLKVALRAKESVMTEKVCLVDWYRE